MITFNKEHPYLLCMDSDGTVMDTMTIKHERCFGPCYLEVFNITKGKEDILREWLDDNLYRKTRGINRFQGLDRIIEYSKKYGYSFLGYEEFHNWVITTKEFSVPSLTEYRKTAKELTTIDLALLWSKRVNEEINKLPESQAFKFVIESIKKASKHCDLVGVSSANLQAVEAEWINMGVMPYVKFLACQDKGNKSLIIKQSLENGYEKSKTIMLGDAPGDYKAAVDNDVYFYPIIPQHENESWERFYNEVIDIIVEGKFDDKYQKQLLDEYWKALE